jgi:hypothetical protein
LFVSFCAVVFTLAVGEGEVGAQPPTAGISLSRPPAYSPYLNMLRSGGTPGQNYYGLVQPQLQNGLALQGLAGDISQNQQALGTLGVGGSLSATGHSTQFMNFGGYFLNNGPVGGGNTPYGGTTNTVFGSGSIGVGGYSGAVSGVGGGLGSPVGALGGAGGIRR